MDCYIVRVYRRMGSKDGRDSEIAGLVEKVGDAGESKAFSSYQSLVSRLREEQLPEAQEQPADTPSRKAVRLVPDVASS